MPTTRSGFPGARESDVPAHRHHVFGLGDGGGWRLRRSSATSVGAAARLAHVTGCEQNI